MLLVIDIGNTNTTLGVYQAESPGDGLRRLAAHWRVSTIKSQTVDEYGVLFRNLFAMAGIKAESGAIHGGLRALFRHPPAVH
jgi:type III pantothenate kinase